MTNFRFYPRRRENGGGKVGIGEYLIVLFRGRITETCGKQTNMGVRENQMTT